ncbi:hypothetical protein AB0F11_22060 [Streptomyces sp. NPDC032472]|uniref:hypothetical protein n=1 Tax=Streptomyces sp. NPDC032472 TaxID=3155018 RepID=UPI003409857A
MNSTERAEPDTEARREAGDAGTVPAEPKGSRRGLRAALRWTAALLVFGGVGAGVAFGVTRAERTDLPGLATRTDGRWAYPPLVIPKPPAGAPSAEGPENQTPTHYSALVGLVLPAPAGARPDEALKGNKDGELSPDVFLLEYAPDARKKIKQSLEWDGLRQITARGWTMPEGTRTRIYLLRFHSAGFVATFPGCNAGVRLEGVSALELDPAWSKAKITRPTGQGFAGAGTLSTSAISMYQETKPVLGEEQTKLGCLQMGDVQAVVIQSRKGEVATVPFHQTVILQSQLLG